jgi:hypothetical protein
VTEERFNIEAPTNCEELFFFERAFLAALGSLEGVGPLGFAERAKHVAYAMLHEWRQTRACLDYSHMPPVERPQKQEDR